MYNRRQRNPHRIKDSHHPRIIPQLPLLGLTSPSWPSPSSSYDWLASNAFQFDGVDLFAPSSGSRAEYVGNTASPTDPDHALLGGTRTAPGDVTDPVWYRMAGSLQESALLFPGGGVKGGVPFLSMSPPFSSPAAVALSILFELPTLPSSGEFSLLAYAGSGTIANVQVADDGTVGLGVENFSFTQFVGPISAGAPHLLTYTTQEDTSESIIQLDGVTVVGPGQLWGGVNPVLATTFGNLAENPWLMYWAGVYPADAPSIVAVNSWAATKGI